MKSKTTMKTKIFLMTVMLSMSHFANAELGNNKSQQLLNVLNQTSIMDDYPAYQQDFDAEQYVNRYKRGWLKAPVFNFDMSKVKNPVVEVQLTAFPNGKIQDVTLLSSSGSSAIDQKIIQVIKKSSLRPMPYPDETMTYSIIQKINLKTVNQ